MREPTECPACGRLTRTSVHGVCPECGALKDPRAPGPPARRLRGPSDDRDLLAWLVPVVLAAAIGIAYLAGGRHAAAAVAVVAVVVIYAVARGGV